MGESESGRVSFGKWLRQKRRILDLTQEAFADQAGCARITLRRIESDALKPSKELALLLLEKAGIPQHEREAWLPFARGLAEPPLKQTISSPAPIRNNLPALLTTFIGREKEQADVIQLLNKHRLVTLTGSGGVGKTRLSIQVAEGLISAYPNGIWLVELAPLTDPALVPQSVCAVMGVKPDGDTSALEALTNYLRSKKILLVLDNCEHLVEACAQLCNSLLRSCPDLRILASSREALAIYGEQAYRVPSLSLPNSKSILTIIQESEAVTLFVERARASQLEFELTEFNASFVAQICQRLDGIALAIELAASRVRTFKVEQIAARLDDAFGLLTSGNLAALPRQQTLRALIDWSYNLLSEEEKIFLRKLSVFMGGWTLEAAEAVCENKDALELLTHLVDKSLVSVDREHGDDVRYYLLETIRQFSREKLIESREDYSTCENHLEYFVKLAEDNQPRRKTAGQKSAFQQMEIEFDNFRAALDWSLDKETNNKNVANGLRIANALDWQDAPNEGLNWLQKGLALIPRGNLNDDLLRANTMTNTAPLLINSGKYTAAIELLNESIELYKSIQPTDKRGWVNALFLLAWAHTEFDFTRARSYGQESVAMARELGEAGKWELALALYWEGCVALRQREYENAKSLVQEGLSIFREFGDNISIADTLHALGQLESTVENYEAAIKYYHQAREIKLDYGLKKSAMFVLNDMSTSERRLGNYATARVQIEECISQIRDNGTQYHLSGSLWQLGDVLIDLNEIEQSTIHLRESLQISQSFPQSRYKGFCLFSLIKSVKLQGKVRDAAFLLGAMEVETSKDFWQFTVYRKAEFDRTYEEVKTALGASVFDKIHAEGKAMTLDQGVAYALEISK
ncbi:MAG: tetratricopeptide repeat protein [Anaerolineales bacterium]|nr:tetratricopeptide repeat protein [Anaerolineales bacterium]